MARIEEIVLPKFVYDSPTFKPGSDGNAKMIDTYDTYPSFTAPANKLTFPGEYNYSLLQANEGQTTKTDFMRRVGYNLSDNKYFNAYVEDQYVKFVNEGGTVEQDGSLNLGPGFPVKWQWINGEQGIGYNLARHDTVRINRMKAFIQQASSLRPNAEFSIYSLEAFQVWGDFYEAAAGNLSKAQLLANYMLTPIDSIQALCGMSWLLEDIYTQGSGPSHLYIGLAMYLNQLKRRKALLEPSVKAYKKLVMLLWSHSENFGYQQRYVYNGTYVKNGEGDGLTKFPALPELNHGVALYGCTSADGVGAFTDRVPTEGMVSVNGTMRDLEAEDIHNHHTQAPVQVTLNGNTQNIHPAKVWLGNNNLVTGAIWQAAQAKDIIEHTISDWFTPDYQYGANLRTGLDKSIPMAMYYKDPLMEVKYSADKSSCLIFLTNPSALDYVRSTVTLKLTNAANQAVDVVLPLVGRRSQLYRYTF
jgi:hypothetical protein